MWQQFMKSSAFFFFCCYFWWPSLVLRSFFKKKVNNEVFVQTTNRKQCCMARSWKKKKKINKAQVQEKEKWQKNCLGLQPRTLVERADAQARKRGDVLITSISHHPQKKRRGGGRGVWLGTHQWSPEWKIVTPGKRRGSWHRNSLALIQFPRRYQIFEIQPCTRGLLQNLRWILDNNNSK